MMHLKNIIMTLMLLTFSASSFATPSFPCKLPLSVDSLRLIKTIKIAQDKSHMNCAKTAHGACEANPASKDCVCRKLHKAEACLDKRRDLTVCRGPGDYFILAMPDNCKNEMDDLIEACSRFVPCEQARRFSAVEDLPLLD